MIPNKHEMDLGWCVVHFEVTDMISNEVFVWVTGVRKPTKVDLARAYLVAEQLSPDFYFYANIDATNPITMQFAHHFGFREVRRAGNISVQVWEKERCKRRSLP